MLDLARDGALALGSNYSMASNSCLRLQLALGEELGMSACVSQTVSPSKRPSMRVRPSSVS